jgi:hypothetical protein
MTAPVCTCGRRGVCLACVLADLENDREAS